MFDFDSLREISSTIRKNKMRTFLTGFAVAWGIFMLIVLLSAGNGLRNGVMSNFESQAKNYVRIRPGRTSMPYNGLPTGRRITFDYKDYNLLQKEVPEIEYLSAGMGTNLTATYGEEYMSIKVESGTPDLQHIVNITIKEGMGRFINRFDDINRRKVLVIHPEHQRVLFKGEDPIGKYIIANGIPYQVIGVYGTSDQFNDSNPPAYMPLSTAQMLYNRGWGFWYFEFTVVGPTTLEGFEAFTNRLRTKLGNLHRFDPTDRSALYIYDAASEALRMQRVFGGINVFLIIIGLASMMAGIVGVGNIMYITVKERTREIGIRKAIGATPRSVIELVIFEAILITTAAGYVGIVLGVGLMELVGRGLTPKEGGDQITMFLNPGVDISTVLWATLLLVACGVVSGLIPALKATRVKPIEAMRAE